MRNLKILMVGLGLAFLGLVFPRFAVADASDVPASASWYFYVDFKQMRAAGPGQEIYAWLRDEVLSEIKKESGLDVESEFDRLVAFSVDNNAGVLLVEGNFSQDTKDKVMAFIATRGDINPLKASGKTYYRFGGNGNSGDDVSYNAGKVAFSIDSLKEESWISTSIRNKIIVTSSEGQMQELLENKGKIAGSGNHNGALVVLTAEKTLLQAGMRSDAFGGDVFDSNILRNTEQAALLIAAAADKLAVEVELTTAEPEMAQSMASVVRGLIGLAAFSDDMDEELDAVLRGTRVDTKGNSLRVSIAIDPNILVTTLRD